MKHPAGTHAVRLAVALALLLPGAPAPGQEAFRLGDITAEPGQAVSGRLDVAPSGGDGGTFLPLTVVHGARPGPVLTLVAGIHGSEYAPILAMQRLRPLLDPAEISGTVVLVHMANLPAFLGRTIYFSPDDRKNLNRLFPGKADGTLSERIAHVLTEEVIVRSNFLMDIHSGEANECLGRSYTGYYAEAGGAEVIEKS
ncbi:MAG: succinylglutamate desuccinylase/aspartoacylase family protein, partial [Acidobacteria bacterium]|nr:succinylglutamate desuccinylase/aspartoacylase family protein [Acidobacteriota bacterium]